MKRTTTTTLCCLLCIVMWASGQHKGYDQWSSLPSRTLVNMGTKYAELDNRPDSALLCFTIVAARYDKSMNKEQKHLCTIAFTGKWYVYFFHYFDYSKAYENLQKAHETAKENGDDLQRIYLDFGCMYHTISEQSGDTRPGRQALDYYRQAFDEALRKKDTATIDMAAANMCTVSHNLGNVEDIDSYMQKYKAIDKNGGLPRHTYTLLLYEGLLAMEKGNWQKALNTFNRQLTLVNHDVEQSRYYYGIKLHLAKTHMGMGNNDKALILLNEAEKLAVKYDIKDARLETYKLTADCCERLGLTELTEQYRNKYFRLKDTLINYRQVASVSELKFLGEIKAMDEQMTQMAQQRRMQNIIMSVITGVAAIVLLLTAVVWIKNRKLQRANMTLYEKNLSMLKREEEERDRRRDYERSIGEMRQQLEKVTTTNREDSHNHNDSHNRQDRTDTNKVSSDKKYKGNNLDERLKKEIDAKILHVMENSEEIYRGR